MSNPEKDAARAALREARSAWERGDAARAELYCRDALTADDEDARAWILLGIVLRRRDPVAAHAALTAAIERDPGHPDAWFHLGNLHREQRRYADAIAAYETAVITAPDNASLHNNLGLALEAAGYPERAEAAYRTALARVAGHRQSLGNLAHLSAKSIYAVLLMPTRSYGSIEASVGITRATTTRPWQASSERAPLRQTMW